jgi:hypothetical protein
VLNGVVFIFVYVSVPSMTQEIVVINLRAQFNIHVTVLSTLTRSPYTLFFLTPSECECATNLFWLQSKAFEVYQFAYFVDGIILSSVSCMVILQLIK